MIGPKCSAIVYESVFVFGSQKHNFVNDYINFTRRHDPEC